MGDGIDAVTRIIVLDEIVPESALAGIAEQLDTGLEQKRATRTGACITCQLIAPIKTKKFCPHWPKKEEASLKVGGRVIFIQVSTGVSQSRHRFTFRSFQSSMLIRERLQALV